NEKCWTDNGSIRKYMATYNKTMNDLVSDFVTRAHWYLEKRGKKPMIWEEALLDFEIPLHKDTIRDLVVGGDVCLWAEQVDPMNLDQTLWPRAAAAAEVLWSGKDKNGEMRSVKDALVRIQDQRFRMVSRGIDATPLQPLWCARNPGGCDLPPS
ncbi:Glucosamine-6-phosphate isomerase (Glucosamine-6-phosphate deaminase) (GNPDA) (GlcN6P deaminase), partial [Dispira parvispora]